MALYEVTTSASTIYLTISEGRIVLRSKTPLDGYEPYTRKDGSIGYQSEKEAVDGYLTKVEQRETDFGKRWAFTLLDGGVIQQLEVPCGDKYAKYIILALANDQCNLAEVVLLKPFCYTPKGKTSLTKGVKVIQNSVQIPWKYGRDETPKWKEVMINGVKKWDYSDELAFLEKVVTESILPRITALPF